MRFNIESLRAGMEKVDHLASTWGLWFAVIVDDDDQFKVTDARGLSEIDTDEWEIVYEMEGSGPAVDDYIYCLALTGHFPDNTEAKVEMGKAIMDIAGLGGVKDYAVSGGPAQDVMRGLGVYAEANYRGVVEPDRFVESLKSHLSDIIESGSNTLYLFDDPDEDEYTAISAQRLLDTLNRL